MSSVIRSVLFLFSVAMISGLPEISQYSKVRSAIETMSRRQEVLSHLNFIEDQVHERDLFKEYNHITLILAHF